MPTKWENNVLGFIPQTDWLSVPFNPTRPNDPSDQLIDDMRTDNLDFAVFVQLWIPKNRLYAKSQKTRGFLKKASKRLSSTPIGTR